MKRFVMAAALALLLACHAAAFAQTAVVDAGTADRIHLRESGEKSAASMGLYFTGTAVWVITEENDAGYAMVQVGNQTGWMASEYLERGLEGMDLAPTPYRGVLTRGASLHVLPQEQAPAWTDVPAAGEVAVFGQTAQGWYYAAYGQEYGYLPGDCLALREGNFPARAPAQTISVSPCGEETFVFSLYEMGMAEHERLCRVVADNGTQRYVLDDVKGVFVPEGMQMLHQTDVNMDGFADMALLCSVGASDAFARHYLYRPDTRHYQRHMGLEELSWYRCEMYPQGRLILNYLREGALYGTWRFLRFEGDELRLIGEAAISPDGDTERGYVVRYGEDMSAQTVIERSWAREDEDAYWRFAGEAVPALTQGLDLGEPVRFDGSAF